ncbi:GNAT family N-acetyltransferase [Amycolatopsis sp. FDAARGOS 1241]|uniref:GNAT family N-acetyltransferase n=1 Tax=Amycolatopsis sp. FDAARGOS 1241 TaxID=2778070 RepID=UPI001950BF17|nr:GNAT family N-acetyltransferase [Amycolatopsis sp. FDAARGOS 1241]QRP47327.1 GNAT family N-acetyltransferase [Amycolatopsis sp. FDAARGOS 1241]
MALFVIRPGRKDDAATLLRFFDEAVEWLVARGSAGQWGDQPWSSIPHRASRVADMTDEPGLRIAEVDGEPAGALIVSEKCPDHVPPAGEPELYIGLLITSRRFAGHRVGARLIEYTLAEAKRRGIGLVRVDCWAGGDGALQRYYEARGFRSTVRFDVGGWLGQVFEQRP